MCDMSGKNDDKRRDIIHYYGDERGDISVDDEIRGFWSQETSQYPPSNHGETVDGDWRCGYRYQNGHYSSHNPCSHGKLLRISVASHRDNESRHDNETCDSRGDNGRCGIMS